MKKVIPIITSAPIKYSFNGLDTYDAFDLVSQGKLTAPLESNAIDFLKDCSFNFPSKSISNIFTAEIGQSVETAELLIKLAITPHAIIIKTPLLNGISFSMEKLLKKDQFILLPFEEALSIARGAFVEQLYKNNLHESLSNLTSRMDGLISLLQSNPESSLCISHAFYIKLLEIYTREKGVFNNLEKLKKSFNPSKKPYEPLSGFYLKI